MERMPADSVRPVGLNAWRSAPVMGPFGSMRGPGGL
jgi:hypothetical protein